MLRDDGISWVSSLTFFLRDICIINRSKRESETDINMCVCMCVCVCVCLRVPARAHVRVIQT